MIANRDLHSELEIIDKVIATSNDPIEIAKAQLKATTLNTKLLSNLRTNTVTIMKHFNIKMKKGAEQTKEQSDA